MFSIKNKINRNFHKEWKFWFETILGFAIVVLLLLQILYGIWSIWDVQTKMNDYIKKHPTMDLEHILDYFRKTAEFDRTSAIWVTIGFGYEGDGIIASAAVGSYIFYWFSFFTHDSNILVAIWLLAKAFARIWPRRDHVFLTYNWSLVVITFITLTSLVYLTILAPVYFLDTAQQVEKLTIRSLLFSGMLHAVFPWMFIIYQVFFDPMKAQYNPKKYVKKKLWGGPLILTIYTIFILIRGETRFQDANLGTTRYPYFFFDIHNPDILGMPGWAWFIITIIAILGIYFGASNFYNWIIWKNGKRLKSSKTKQLLDSKKTENEKVKTNKKQR
ncbi:Pr6Pr family membrane protein [Williamsoniiplasma lucivorax]|uniref:Transmembrane protein n=1 Tax=Williamsoniiplasma lucivorax TaxID=209274 RepID=A0A2S5RDX1_9MOLU|nr:Pr6Pr family membrane protein [Williamsoniiplasma lucivorax]PPE05516.1 hypothetical protein ELUCI_v1c06090 [Williamsoniiplasma lucivorax]